MSKIGDILLPGDTINDLICHNGAVILGPGLKKHFDEDRKAIVTRCGTFCHKPPNAYWIESQQKRYVPKTGEAVIGIIVAKRGDLLKVDIGSSELASLLMFSFEGATKKQKPDVHVGDVVYAKLLTAMRKMEPELVCVDSLYKAGRLGILNNEGFLFTITQELMQKLLNYNNLLLKILGQKIAYEIVIGMNAKIWVNAKNNPNDIDVIYRSIKAAENLSDHDIQLIYR